MAYIFTFYLRLLTYYIHKLVTLLHVILYSIIFKVYAVHKFDKLSGVFANKSIVTYGPVS